MSARVAPAPATACLAAGLLLGACGASSQAREESSAASAEARASAHGPADVCGTVIEASTGRPLAGVLVEAPDGSRTRTDADGRFELVGLAAGLTGTLRAWTDAGLAGENRLRPLVAGRLEVVIHLR